jgi:hypothetical protein
VATFGAIRRQVTQTLELGGHTGVHPDLIDDAINQSYTAILDALGWRRQRVEGILQLVAPYKDGTLEVTSGQTGVTVTGGTFTSAMTGRAIRINGEDAYYEFTRTGAATGTLDRAYAGDTATDLGYSIFQTVYALPGDCRVLESIRSFSLGPLDFYGRRAFNDLAGARHTEGTPLAWSRFMDSATDPPVQMIEVYPAPDAAIGLPFAYFADAVELGPTDTAVSLVPWARPAALVAGALADVLSWIGDDRRAAAQEAKFAAALAQIQRTEIQAQPVQRMRLPERLTRHRIDRAIGRRRLSD